MPWKFTESSTEHKIIRNIYNEERRCADCIAALLFTGGVFYRNQNMMSNSLLSPVSLLYAVSLMYPNGEFTKDELEEVLRLSLEMRRRVKEQLKKLGGMEFYDVNFSYIDNETFEEKYVSVPEQGGDTLIPELLC